MFSFLKKIWSFICFIFSCLTFGIVIPCIAIVAIIATITYGPTLHDKFIRNYVGSKVVSLTINKFNEKGEMLGVTGGTGFFVKAKSGKTFIMTNRHVCEVNGLNPEGKTMNMYSQNLDKKGTAKILFVSHQYDICILDNGGWDISGLYVNPFDASIGDQMFTIGHPMLEQLNYERGEIMGYEKIEIGAGEPDMTNGISCGVYEAPASVRIETVQMFIFSFKVCVVTYDKVLKTTNVIYGGSSGSPMINPFGLVTGIMFAGMGGDVEHRSWAMPVDYIRDVLNKF